MQELLFHSDAGVAQLVEQLIRNEKVGSSSLFSGTIAKQPEFISGFFVSAEYERNVELSERKLASVIPLQEKVPDSAMKPGTFVV